jgi:diacylglycerol kinase family enzyme
MAHLEHPTINDYQIEHATALINPVSSTSRQGLRRLRKLEKKAPFDIEALSTSKNRNITQAIIGESLENSDLVIPVSGDGGSNLVVHTIATNDKLSKKARQTPVWYFGGGNANDGQKSQHTKYNQLNPENVIKDGRIVEAYPLRFDITTNGEKTTRIAALYGALGAIAVAASDLDNPKHRNRLLNRYKPGRCISELYVTAKAIKRAEMNEVEKDGETKRFFSIIFANSHIMGKYMRFPTKLTKREIFVTEIADNKLSHVAYSALRGFRGTSEGNMLDEDSAYNLHTTHDLYAQFDGEAIIIPPDSDISISIHPTPLYIVVTNPDL